MLHDTRTLALSDRDVKIKTWLSPVDASINYRQALSQRHPGTGRWFLDSERYAQWKAESSSVLWFHGIPGCGKSVLSSTIIENLQQGNGATEHVLLYFFFNFNDVEKQTFDKMLRTLIFGMYSQRPECQKHLDQLYSSCGDGREQPQNKSLVATLDSMIAGISNVSIVLDALDECRTRKDLLPWLRSLGQQAGRLLVTSRKEEDIESSLTKWLPAASMVPIQQSAVDNDIRAVVRSRLEEDGDFERWRSMPDVQDLIEQELMKKADGM